LPQREEAITVASFTRTGKSQNFSTIYESNIYRLFIYGGHDIREGSMDNLWVVDLTTFDDLDQEPEDQDKDCAWKLRDTNGESPAALSHSTPVV
jgi:hypothetical protein